MATHADTIFKIYQIFFSCPPKTHLPYLSLVIPWSNINKTREIRQMTINYKNGKNVIHTTDIIQLWNKFNKKYLEPLLRKLKHRGYKIRSKQIKNPSIF